jgi:hypothetical protein
MFPLSVSAAHLTRYHGVFAANSRIADDSSNRLSHPALAHYPTPAY